MSIATEAAGIKGVLDSVADIGVTFDYAPVPKNDWATFVASFTTTVAGYDAGRKHVRAWTVAYIGESRERRTVAIGNTKVDRSTRWVIRGFLGWADPDSDPAFRNLVEAVADALDAAVTLGGAVEDHTPVEVSLPERGTGVLLGDVLCHYAEVSLTAKTTLTAVTA